MDNASPQPSSSSSTPLRRTPRITTCTLPALNAGRKRVYAESVDGGGSENEDPATIIARHVVEASGGRAVLGSDEVGGAIVVASALVRVHVGPELDAALVFVKRQGQGDDASPRPAWLKYVQNTVTGLCDAWPNRVVVQVSGSCGPFAGDGFVVARVWHKVEGGGGGGDTHV